jgi:hypothetical protein
MMLKLKIVFTIIFRVLDKFIKNINLQDTQFVYFNNGVFMINYNNLEDCDIDHMILHDW